MASLTYGDGSWTCMNANPIANNAVSLDHWYTSNMTATNIVYVDRPVEKPTVTAKEVKPMRGLFEVFIVNPESGEILGPYRVVANDAAAARLKVVGKHLDLEKVDLDDYDICVLKLGDVRHKKSVQTVKLAP